MTSRRRQRPGLHLGALITALALAACSAPAPGAVGPTQTPTQAAGTASPAPTPTRTSTPTPAPTATPTEPARDFHAVGHPSGVFSLNIPQGWEPLDSSTERRLQVRYLPPAGYGSRISVQVTDEGPRSPEEVRALAESFIETTYAGTAAYRLIASEERPDGSLRYEWVYDDGLGGTGREVLTVRQDGPYFSTLRVFLADDDAYRLAGALETAAASFRVDPVAQWNSGVAAVNPAELLVVNALLWRAGANAPDAVYTGEVRNASGTPVQDVEVRLALCDQRGIVLREYGAPVGLAVIPPGGASPFAVAAADAPRNAEVCAASARAVPAPANARYSADLVVEASGEAARDALVVQGTVFNPGLAPLTDIAVLIAAYDVEGRVIGFEVATLGPSTVLQPGESTSFEHTLDALGGELARFTAGAEGHVLAATGRRD